MTNNNIDSYIFDLKNVQKCEQIEPILELYKGKLYSCLNKLFINDCINIFGIHIFSIKKSYYRTLTNILASWIFSLYIDYDFSNDYFFPSNYTNTISLENILYDLCKYDDKIINIKEKINYLINNLKINYKNQLDLLLNYKKSDLFLNNKKLIIKMTCYFINLK